MVYKRNEDHVSGTPGTWEPDAKKKRKRYVKRVIDAVLTTVILLVINVIALYVLLQGCRMAWSVYLATSVGQQYNRMHPDVAALIAGVIHSDPFQVSVYYVLAAFVTCLVIAGVLQLLGISRFFYEPMGIFRRMLFFGLPLAYIIGFLDSRSTDLVMINRSFAIALVPTLMVFRHCFRHTRLLIPEIGDVMAQIRKRFSEDDDDD